MSRTTYNQKTSTMPGYGIIFPDSYQEGGKLPVEVFLHGIGEISTKKTLQQAVDFHSWFKKAADIKNMIYILPQDDGSSLFDDKELMQLKPIVEKYSNGQVILSGLSRGAGTTLSVAMSTSAFKELVTCYIVLCPPTWESMNEKVLASSDVPMWWFHGAKDAADTATVIARAVNTVDDIRKAGRTKNFYFSVFPNDDHFIWTEVMGAIGRPPITPALGATSYKGSNTETKIVNGVSVSAPIAIEVECVNDPTIDVYDFMLLQKKGDYKPLPRLSDAQPEPQPIPEPIPEPTPTPEPAPIPEPVKTIKRVNATSTKMGISFQNEDNSPGGTLSGATEVDAVKLKTGKVRITIFGALKKVLKTIEL